MVLIQRKVEWFLFKGRLNGSFPAEIDFSRKTASATNGVNQGFPEKCKKGPGDYKSVTGDFLEEVVSLVNMKCVDDSGTHAQK